MTNVDPVPPTPGESQFTEQEVQKIVAEERLRNRLRLEFELKAPEKAQSKWWSFLNSHFGLFLLSSVVLAGLTGLYAQAQNHSRQQELRNQEILKITTELKYRLELITGYDEAMKKAQKGNKVGASLFVWYTVKGGPENYHASLPEFSGVTTYGLVGRLRLLGITGGTEKALTSVMALEKGQTEPDGGNQNVYPETFLDAQIGILNTYVEGVLVPYLDRERKKSLIHDLLF